MYFESAVAAEYFLLENDVLWFLYVVLNSFSVMPISVVIIHFVVFSILIG